jgi:membrane-associated phospholipid phosphatase
MAGALAGTNVTPGNPVKYVAGIQLIGSPAGVVRWPARRCLGFPVLYPKWGAAGLLVGITRMYVGAHYPRDVLAGAILGSAWGLLGVLVDGYVLNGIG